MNLKHIIRVTIICFLFSCCNNQEKVGKDVFWENFKQKLQKNDINYLLKNSLDSINCSDCNSNSIDELFSSKAVFSKYKNQFYKNSLLDNKNYTVNKNDSFIRVNYIFVGKNGNEGHNIIYIFDKIDNQFLLSGKITIP